MSRQRLRLAGRIPGSRLTVIRFVEMRHKETYWECVCDCGKLKIVRGGNLVSGNVKSCGCLREDYMLRRRSRG